MLRVLKWVWMYRLHALSPRCSLRTICVRAFQARAHMRVLLDASSGRGNLLRRLLASKTTTIQTTTTLFYFSTTPSSASKSFSSKSSIRRRSFSSKSFTTSKGGGGLLEGRREMRSSHAAAVRRDAWYHRRRHLPTSPLAEAPRRQRQNRNDDVGKRRAAVFAHAFASSSFGDFVQLGVRLCARENHFLRRRRRTTKRRRRRR